jgi:hypothetical protein
MTTLKELLSMFREDRALYFWVAVMGGGFGVAIAALILLAQVDQ